MDWFTVDKAGLAKVLARKGKAFALYELIQNAWDTDAGRVKVTLSPVVDRPLVWVKVEDNSPEGFKNLTHAFTLFAESDKKADASKRGRFNLGEKLVLALCDEATIESTKGTVIFNRDGRHTIRTKRETGSLFVGRMKMTREELEEVTLAVQALIEPGDVKTYVNGEPLPLRHLEGSFEATLPTELANEDGLLYRSERRTRITLHQVQKNKTAKLYELNIPIVELKNSERWHVNVHQKIPLNMDRDNVNPAYLRAIRVHLANAMRNSLTKEDAWGQWLDEATGDKRVEPATVDTMLDLRFGEKRAVFDPSDREANKALMNDGYTVIPGGSLSKAQWGHVREHGLALPSGKIKPSAIAYDLDGLSTCEVIAPSNYTEGQRNKVTYAMDLARHLLGKEVGVVIVNDPKASYLASFGKGGLALNLGRLGKDWFECSLVAGHNELLLHEFAHAKVGDHLTHEFANEVARLFAKLVDLALAAPGLLYQHGYIVSGEAHAAQDGATPT